jgi:hypothetical protein
VSVGKGRWGTTFRPILQVDRGGGLGAVAPGCVATCAQHFQPLHPGTLAAQPVLAALQTGALAQHDINRITLDMYSETTRTSADGIPNLSTSVVVPGGLPRAIPVSAIPKSIQKGKNNKVEYNIYFITLIRVHLFGTCRVQVQQD